MTVEISATPGAGRGAAGERLRGRRSRAVERGLGAVLTVTLLVCAAAVSVWPTLTPLVVGLAFIAALAWFAPSFALVGAVLLYGLEGAIKLGIAREIPRFGSPDALGAALIDGAFLLAVLGLLRHDRGRTIRAIWRNTGRWPRIALGLLVAWLVLSVLQIPVAGDLNAALSGFRLTQAYVLAAVAGTMLLARSRPQHVVTALVAVLLVIATYAAFRAVAGPAESERLAAFGRSTTPLVPGDDGVIFRNVGSSSSAIGLASFLVPAGVFLLALGSAVLRLRLAAGIGVALVVVALVGTYVRAGLVAFAFGVICAAALAASTRVRGKTRIALALAAAPLLVSLLVLGALAPTLVSGGSPEVRERSSGVFQPLSDPSLTLRYERWRSAVAGVSEHPLGTGLGTVGAATVDEQNEATFADNSYVKVLQEQGPLGLVLFAIGVFGAAAAVAARIGRRDAPQRSVGTAAISASLSFFLFAWTSEAIEQPGKVLAWLFFGIALWASFASPPDGGRPEPREAT